jgi:hypothetical protein
LDKKNKKGESLDDAHVVHIAWVVNVDIWMQVDCRVQQESLLKTSMYSSTGLPRNEKHKGRIFS